MAIEDEFEMEIEDQAASQIATVQDVLNYIENGRIYFNIAAFLIASTSGKFLITNSEFTMDYGFSRFYKNQNL
jgi:hypothetical protein